MENEIWTVYRKCTPYDEDMCWEFEMEYFESREDAIRFANELEQNYADEGWSGHRYHKSRFYASPITKEEIEEKQRRWARQMANSI